MANGNGRKPASGGSFRLSANPNDNFSIQLSHGYLKSPEELEPETDKQRGAISVIHSVILGKNIHLNSSAIWGVNHRTFTNGQHSFLVESNLQINRTAIYWRWELIQKDARDLHIPQMNGKDEVFLIKMLTIGASYNFLKIANTNVRAGLQGSIYSSDKKLDSFYGKNPMALEIYLHLTPVIINTPFHFSQKKTFF